MSLYTQAYQQAYKNQNDLNNAKNERATVTFRRDYAQEVLDKENADALKQLTKERRQAQMLEDAKNEKHEKATGTFRRDYAQEVLDKENADDLKQLTKERRQAQMLEDAGHIQIAHTTAPKKVDNQGVWNKTVQDIVYGSDGKGEAGWSDWQGMDPKRSNYGRTSGERMTAIKEDINTDLINKKKEQAKALAAVDPVASNKMFKEALELEKQTAEIQKAGLATQVSKINAQADVFATIQSPETLALAMPTLQNLGINLPPNMRVYNEKTAEFFKAKSLSSQSAAQVASDKRLTAQAIQEQKNFLQNQKDRQADNARQDARQMLEQQKFKVEIAKAVAVGELSPEEAKQAAIVMANTGKPADEAVAEVKTQPVTKPTFEQYFAQLSKKYPNKTKEEIQAAYKKVYN
jgi:hypothetical protein